MGRQRRHSEVRLRLRRGVARDARPARRQGRERRRDDARSSAPIACPRASRSRPRPASPTCSAGRELPDGLDEQVDEALERLESRAGKRLGDADDPLLVSVRSGARESMPGMLDTVLNLGLNDASVEGLAARTENERFAWDSYRRFVQMFGNVVRGIPGERFEAEIAAAKQRAGVKLDTELDVGAAARAAGRVRQALQGRDRRGLPAGPARPARAGDPRGLRLLAGRARGLLPAHQPHPRRLGHGGQRPADGLRQQGRHVGLGRRLQPRRGHRRARAVGRLPRQRPGRGRRLRRAQHAGHRRAARRHARGARAADGDPALARGATTRTCRTRSSRSRKGVCTCCRRATPSVPPRPACASPCDAVGEGLLTKAEAIDDDRLREARRAAAPDLRPRASTTPCSRTASPRRRALPRARSSSRRTTPCRPPPTGRHVILVRPFTEAEDVAGFFAAQGILTAEGGKASHAALVARGMGGPAVTGASALNIDLAKRELRVGETLLCEGDSHRDRRHDGQHHDRRRAARRAGDERALRAGAELVRRAAHARHPRERRHAGGRRARRARSAPRASVCAAPSTCSWPPTASRRCAR